MATAGSDVARSEQGTWVKGQSGNPAGRPPGRKAQVDVLKQNLEIAVREVALKPQRIINIINKMCDLAESGDVKAAKLVLSMAVSPASQASDAVEERSGITIRIENATFAAKNNQPTPIEATVITEDSKANG